MRTPLIILMAAASQIAAAQSSAVAQLGAIQLSASDVERVLAAQPPEVRAQLAASPAVLVRVLQTELVRRALLAEALANGWDKRPEVAARIDRAREQAVVTSYVNSLARPPADYPPEAEVAAFYQANQAQLMRGRELQLAQIYLRRPADAALAQAVASRAGRLAAEARASGADFGALARQSSEHAESAARGGDMGWLSEEVLVPEVRTAATRLAKGEVSEPVATKDGWHIVKLVDTKPPAPAPLAEVRAAIVDALRLRKAQELERAYIDQLLAKSPATVNEPELAKLRGALR
jgi:peptidylprolyl isomerase